MGHKKAPSCKSIDRAKEMLRYEPQMDFEEGLKTTINWFQKNWENIQKDAEFPPGMSAAVFGSTLKNK